jgi:hypothetical protein
MALYKRLMAGLRHYIRLWWVVIVLCVVVSAQDANSADIKADCVPVLGGRCHFIDVIVFEHEGVVHGRRMQHPKRHQSCCDLTILRICSGHTDRSDEYISPYPTNSDVSLTPTSHVPPPGLSMESSNAPQSETGRCSPFPTGVGLYRSGHHSGERYVSPHPTNSDGLLT